MSANELKEIADSKNIIDSFTGYLEDKLIKEIEDKMMKAAEDGQYWVIVECFFIGAYSFIAKLEDRGFRCQYIQREVLLEVR